MKGDPGPSSFFFFLKNPHPRVFFPLIFFFFERVGRGERKRDINMRETH